MSKEKWKAYFITVIVLFILVRMVESCKNKQSSDVLIEEIKDNIPANLEEISEPRKIEIKPSTIKVKKPAKKEALNQIDKPKKATITKNKNPYKSQKTSVFFKVENGLALAGGDMILGQLKEDQDVDYNNIFEKDVEKTKLWPGPTIPFGITDNVSKDMKAEILEAIKYMNEKTNLNFVPLESSYDEDAIVFEKRSGSPCSSYIGRIGGYQPIYINESKCGKQEVMHELLHAIGFVHEQQRVSRDSKIEILWDNIQAGNEHNFSILPDELIHPYSGSVFDIDFKSVMIYPEEAFAKSGLKSMKSKIDEPIKPTKSGLSDIDIERINYLYN